MISLLVVNYFSHALTVRAVNSALADDPSIQVIVVDNSADSTETEALRKNLPGVAELVVAPVNLGFGRACNLALEHAKGEWILLLNPDVLVLPGCLATLIYTLRSHPQAGAVSPVAQWDEAGSFILPPGQMQSPFWEWLLTVGTRLPKCRVPDDYIDSRRYPLFMARDVMRGLIEQLKAEERTAS